MTVKKNENIIFSSTRQWNPGDEFILMGVRAILKRLNVKYNSMLFNRNPDIRSCFEDRQIFKYSRLDEHFIHNPDLIDLEANIKFDFFDNSVKPNRDYSYVDWVIFAGTPEWSSGRMCDLYSAIIRYQLPVIILGVGGNADLYCENFREVIQKSKLFTVRSESTLKAVEKQGFSASLMPCPALLCAPTVWEKTIIKVKRIGLIFHATRDDSVIWNGFSAQAYAFMMSLFQQVITDYGETHEISLVCHYIDEVAVARAAFPDLNVAYSHDAADYFEIYSTYDLVIGPRVHGVGVAASMGIPGIAISHDQRGSTTAGFLADILDINDDPEASRTTVRQVIEAAPAKSAQLREHKAQTMERYVEMVREAMADRTVSYESRWDFIPSKTYTLDDLRPLMGALEMVKYGHPADVPGREERLSALVPEMRERLINIEHKINHMMRERE